MLQRIAVIFDVDGTLVKSEHLDALYFIQALKDIAGDVVVSEDWSNYKKVTDVGIITEILEQNRISRIDKFVTEIRSRFGQLLKSYFDEGGACIPVTGINVLLHQLISDRRFAIGIATGGWGHTAIMKLSAAGIDIADVPMSTSDDGDDRIEIMLHCIERMQGTFNRIVYIGDGIWDRDASYKLGWRFIGIGKKVHGKCRYWFEDYRDIGEVLRIIGQ